MSDTTPIRYDREIPDVFTALQALHRTLDTYGLDRTIYHLGTSGVMLETFGAQCRRYVQRVGGVVRLRRARGAAGGG